MNVICEVQSPDLLKKAQASLPNMRAIVQTHAERVAALARAQAPSKGGALRTGIVSSPWEENSREPFKIGRQVYMDHRMNATFVKTRKDGKRYYYPASQEHGFLVRGGKTSIRKVKGRYFLKSARNMGSGAFSADLESFVKEMISE